MPLHLKQTFPPIIWIFTDDEGDRIEFRLPFKIFSALSLPWKLDNPYCYIDREDLDSVLSAAQFLKIRGLIRHDSEDEEDLVETNSVNEPRWDTFFLDFSCFRKFYLGHQIQEPIQNLRILNFHEKYSSN